MNHAQTLPIAGEQETSDDGVEIAVVHESPAAIVLRAREWICVDTRQGATRVRTSTLHRAPSASRDRLLVECGWIERSIGHARDDGPRRRVARRKRFLVGFFD